MALPAQNAIESLINSQQLKNTAIPYPQTNNKVINWILEQRRRFQYIPNISENDKFIWVRMDLPVMMQYNYEIWMQNKITEATNNPPNPMPRALIDRPTRPEHYRHIARVETFLLESITIPNNKASMLKKLRGIHYPLKADPREIFTFLETQFANIDEAIGLINRHNGNNLINTITEEEKCNIIRSIYHTNNNCDNGNSSNINKRIRKYMESLEFHDVATFRQLLPRLVKKAKPDVLTHEQFNTVNFTRGHLELDYTNKTFKKRKLDNPSNDEQPRNKRPRNNERKGKRGSRKPKSEIPCKYGHRCNRADCKFQHSAPQQTPNNQQRNDRSGDDSRQNKRFNGKCNYCGKKGHKKFQCYKFKRQQSNQYNNRNNNGNNGNNRNGNSSQQQPNRYNPSAQPNSQSEANLTLQSQTQQPTNNKSVHFNNNDDNSNGNSILRNHGQIQNQLELVQRDLSRNYHTNRQHPRHC